MPRYKPTTKRFWEKVNKNGQTILDTPCWQWTGTQLPAGYGYLKISRSRKQVLAHRFSYELHNGKIPDGKFVCHRCDNPSCVNPNHLFLGTNTVNRLDSKNKNRHAKGESHGHAKLTKADVIAIRTRYATGGISWKKLASEFGVSSSQIGNIVNRRKWTHIP